VLLFSLIVAAVTAALTRWRGPRLEANGYSTTVTCGLSVPLVLFGAGLVLQLVSVLINQFRPAEAHDFVPFLFVGALAAGAALPTSLTTAFLVSRLWPGSSRGR
jgi:hypothetical protein